MSETRRRPTRACTARTPSRLAPLAPAIERPTPQKKQTGANSEPSAPLVFSTTSPLPAQKERWELRCMWQLASVINFFNTFRPMLKINPEFSGEELETALLTPNNLLIDIHIALLKGIPPPSRISVSRDTWVTVLSKKLKDRWAKVAEGPFPLAASHGNEAEVYKGFDPETRVIILKALCEIRLDQDDVRGYTEESIKQGYLSSIRKERSAVNSHGTTYWYEDDSVSGQRLYRELRMAKEKEVRGRDAAPPSAGQWETLASSLDEFHSVTETLLSSKNKQEIGLGKKLKLEVLPALEEIQKKKEKALKRQQRQALLLNTALQENGLIVGRARRDRKPVKYTFDEYDKSINEAIKFTRKRTQSPETAVQFTNGDSSVANGHVDHSRAAGSKRNGLSDVQPLHEEQPDDGEPSNEGGPSSVPDPSDDHDPSNNHELSDDAGPSDDRGTSDDHGPSDDAETSDQDDTQRSRQRRRSQRYSDRDYVDAAYAEEDDLYSDDEIEGEAIYDDAFVQNKQRKKRYERESSVDEEYREDEDEDEDVDVDVDVDVDEEDGVGANYSEEEEEPVHRPLARPKRKGRKSKSVDDLGLRRSKRATRSKVNYNTYEDSEMEEEEDVEEPRRTWRGTGDKVSGSSVEDADYSMGSESSGAHRSTEDSDREVEPESGRREDKQEESKSWNHANGDEDENEVGERRQLRFLDLNECAPADSPRDATNHKSIGSFSGAERDSS